MHMPLFQRLRPPSLKHLAVPLYMRDGETEAEDRASEVPRCSRFHPIEARRRLVYAVFSV